ncbi:unnamed protein product [Rotaria magnacalcarata]|uniref:Uncharacterized protein n=1 Tax=Rotaria magnacalcarata TaxID=392030 RepID=A0A8S2P1U7_9BILA|nr:unnamed protein product [Rotaria magnacalcarata]
MRKATEFYLTPPKYHTKDLVKVYTDDDISHERLSADQAIVKSFVPDNLGFGHVTPQDVIGRHTTAIARELMCGGDSTDTEIIIIDGTYLYIQKSRKNELQRKTLNLYKKISLLKSMMIVTTTGYIVACIEHFMSDFNNNDAAIMNDILLLNTDNILS